MDDLKEDLKDKDAIGVVDTETTILTGFKKTNYPGVGTVWIKFPTLQEEAEITRYYSECYTRLLNESTLFTQYKLRKILSEKGEWTEEDEKKIDDLQELYVSKAVTIEQIKSKKRLTDNNKKELEVLEKEQDKVYSEWMLLNLTKNQLFENTIEGQAEQEALRYKLVKCVLKEDKTPLWNSIDDLLKVEAHPDFGKLLTECLDYWRGVSVPFYEDLLSPIAGSNDTQ